MSEPDLPDPPLTPAQEAAVRRALGRAGGPEPLPPEVAHRLDGVLADLIAERAGEQSGEQGAPPPLGPRPTRPPSTVLDAGGTVVPMDAAARRRRNRARVVLGAVAASVAIAVGAGVLNERDTRDTNASAGNADRASDEASDPTLSRDPEAPVGTQGVRPTEPGDGATPDASESSEPLRRIDTNEPLRDVRRAQLREDLIAVQQASLPPSVAADYSGSTLTAPADFRCASADYGQGYLVGVSYEGKPAVVAFRQPVGETQAAEVLTCGTADLLHSTTLPAPN